MQRSCAQRLLPASLWCILCFYACLSTKTQVAACDILYCSFADFLWNLVCLLFMFVLCSILLWVGGVNCSSSFISMLGRFICTSLSSWHNVDDSDHNSYSLSKLCNAMHAIELASRLEKTMPKVKVSLQLLRAHARLLDKSQLFCTHAYLW